MLPWLLIQGFRAVGRTRQLVEMSENLPLMKHAAALVARRAYSRGELRRALADRQRTGDIDDIEAVLDRLEELKLLNDDEFAYNFSFYRMKELGWGEEKVLAALLYKDVAKTVAKRALDRVREEIAPDGANVALMEYVESYCRKHGAPSTLKDAQKLARRLAGRGFDEADIVGALRRLITPDIFRHFIAGD